MQGLRLTVVSGALALLVLTHTAPTAQALQILGGDASCDGFGTCTIDNIDPIVKPVADETYEIILRDMQHIEIFDNDGFEVTVLFGVGSPISNQSTLTVSVDFGFSDMNGDPVGPDVGGFSTDLLPGEGVGNSIQLVDAPLGGSFILHDFEIFLTCGGCDSTNFLNTSPVNGIENVASRRQFAHRVLGSRAVDLVAADVGHGYYLSAESSYCIASVRIRWRVRDGGRPPKWTHGS